MTKKNNKKSTIGVLPLIEENGNAAKTVLEINSPQPKALEKAKGRTNYLGFKKYMHENKKLIISTAAVLGLTAYVALFPLGGYSSLKQKWTKPLEQKVEIAENQKKEYTKLYLSSKKKMGSLETEVKKLKETADNFRNQLNKKINLQQRITESYNPNCFYDAQINADESALELQTASIEMNSPVDNKYNMTFCGARHIINDDLSEILGDKWGCYSQNFVDGKVDIDFELKKYGKQIKVLKWDKYDTVFEEKASILVDDKELKAIKKMMDKYRNGNGNDVTK